MRTSFTLPQASVALADWAPRNGLKNVVSLVSVMLVLVMGGVGLLYGGVIGAVVFKLMRDLVSSITPQYWTFWIGLFLVVLVLVGRERLVRPWTWFRGGTRGGRS